MLSVQAPDLPEIIGGLDKRISNLESLTYVYGDPDNANNPPLTITGMTATVAYTLMPSLPVARVTWSWNAVAQDTEDLTTDLVVEYMFGASLAGATQLSGFNSVGTETTVTIDDLPINTVVTGRVYAITKKRIQGPTSTLAVDVTQDTTPPIQPSTPVVTSTFLGVAAAWDGKDVVGAAMPSDFSWTEVHASPTGPAFTPTTDTFRDRLYAAGTSYIDVPSYALTYVRLVSIDAYGNTSVPSTAGSATPRKAVQTDLDIALPGDIAFRDEGNFVPDGSFESPTMRASRIPPTNYAYLNTAGFAKWGTWAVQCTGNGLFYLEGGSTGASESPVTPGTKVYLRTWIRGISASGTASVGIRWTDSAGGTTLAALMSTGTSTGAYVLFEGVYVVPATAITAAVYLQTSSMTTGTWYFDAVEFRKVIGTVLIEDAAITNAKIGLLAVNTANIGDLQVTDAKIGNMYVSKLLTGTLYADMTLSSRLKTADSGQRVELNWAGIQQYNSVGTLVVSIPSSGADAYFRGTFTANLLRTNNATRYIELGDTGSNDPTDELRMFNSYTVSSIRNPSDDPGCIRMSLANGLIFNFKYASDVSSHGIIRGPGTCVKFLSSGYGIQIRDYWDSGYANLICQDFNAQGLLYGAGAYTSTTTGAANMNVASNGLIRRFTSSLRYKTDVITEDTPIEAVMALRPVTYYDKKELEEVEGDTTKLTRYMGLIAEEVAEIPELEKNLVIYDEEGRPDALNYSGLTVALIPAIQEMNRRIAALEAGTG